MKVKMFFIKACYYVGFAADLAATVPLVCPGAAQAMFGLDPSSVSGDYLYVARVGASLMMGWTLLLLWGSFKPIERRGVLLLTVCPVCTGLVPASILAVTSGTITAGYMIPLWIFYVIMVPAFCIAYVLAVRMKSHA